MYCCEFLRSPVLNKKGYYFYGDLGVVDYLLYDQFPTAYKVQSIEELASSAPGYVIVEPWLAMEALGYVGLPASDRAYLFLSEGVKNESHLDILKGFTKAKLPRVDCSNPATPKTQQLTVEYIQHRTKLPESLARKFAGSMQWDLGTIFSSLRLWEPIAGKHPLPEVKALNLIKALTPPDPLEDFLDNLFNGTFHRIHDADYEVLQPMETLVELSDRLNKLRILMEVYTRQKNTSTLLRESGLTAQELKEYIPLAKKWNKTQLKYWLDVMVWAYPRVNNPRGLPAMVSLLSCK